MLQHIPNLLTLARLVISVALFVLLSLYQPREQWSLLLDLAVALFFIALATDFLDGFLARRWKVEGRIGRIIDPLVDKVLVLGCFILLLGANFSHYRDGVPHNLTGVAPWMVIVLLLRELLITGLRSVSEGHGQSFAAAFSGKLKMVLQSVAIVVILLYVNHRRSLGDLEPWARLLRDLCIWVMLLITLLSGALYVRRAVQHARSLRA